MKPQWFIETTIFEQNTQSLMEEIESQGMTYETAEGAEERWGISSYLDLFEKDDCVIYRGSLEFGGQVMREAPWIPGVYRDLPKYDCTNYYPKFGKYLLNEEYIMLPWGDLRRRKDWLFEKVGNSDAAFIRPNAGNKIFAGKVVYKENWDKDLELLGFYDVPDDELCVVCYPRNVGEEMRWVVVDGEIITGSVYKDEEGNVLEEAVTLTKDSLSWRNAASILDNVKYHPERVWTFDTCFTKSRDYYVLEVGCFSCAGLYGAAMEPIVREVSRIALEEWEEHHDLVEN